MISIVIPNYNGSKLLEKNLPRLIGLLEKSKLKYEIIVCDDCSTDNSLSILNNLSGVKILSSNKNLGFAGNIDRGIRAARGEIVFILKTDVLPEKNDYFQLMLDHFKDPKVFAVSAALKTVEDGKEEIRGSGEIYFEKGFFLHRRRDPSASPGISSWADGGAMAVRKDLYVKIGGFDPVYNPFYWEDVDLGYRAWKAGYQIDFEPKAILNHDFESGVIAQNYTKGQVKTISQRNQFVFVWKNGDIKHVALHCLWWSFHAAVALKNGNWSWFLAHLWAKWLGLSILRARWRQKKVAKLFDDEVLAKLN